MGLDLSTRYRDGCVIVRIRGECDVANAGMLHEFLIDLLTRKSARMVLDLSRLYFLDCAGARSFQAVSHRAILEGGALVLATPAANVSRMLEVTGLDESLAVFAEPAAAVASLQPGRPVLHLAVPAARRHAETDPAEGSRAARREYQEP